MAKSKYTDIDLSKYDNGFQNTDAINTALQKKTDAENALAALGDFNFTYGREDAYNKAMDDNLNRKAFSYDLNADMLYQQYKDNYINQGKMAMMDTMGQAASMTGGYGNSYAQTVGQQAYQGHLQNLNNMIPELYQMALDRYNAEGDRLAMNFNLLNTDRQNALSEYSTQYNTNLNKLTSNRDYYGNEYNNVYNRDYGAWNDQRTYDTSQYWNEYNTGYQAEQDAIANQLARDQLAEQIRANKASEGLAWAKYNDSKTQAAQEAKIKAVNSIRDEIGTYKEYFEYHNNIKPGDDDYMESGNYNRNHKSYINYRNNAEKVIDNAYRNGDIGEEEWNALRDEFGL